MYLFCIGCKLIVATIKVPTLVFYRQSTPLQFSPKLRFGFTFWFLHNDKCHLAEL